MKYWFENEYSAQPDRRNNRLQRIAHEAHEQDEGRIQTWLDLANKVFEKDDDSDPEAA